MVVYFSVDWLAQSHHDSALEEKEGAGMGNLLHCKPHIPCMLQPSPPGYGKSYLQPKPKSFKPQEPVATSASHSTRCTTPSKSLALFCCFLMRIMFLTRIAFIFQVQKQAVTLRDTIVKRLPRSVCCLWARPVRRRRRALNVECALNSATSRSADW